MESVLGKSLEGVVLRDPPGFGMNMLDSCKISNDERINAIILVKGVKGLLVLLYIIGVEAVDPCAKRNQLFGGGKVIGDMDTVKSGRFQANEDSMEFMVL